MKAKMSGQFQGSGGKQSIEIDGSIDLPDFAKLLERVANLEEEVRLLSLKELTAALKEDLEEAPATPKQQETPAPIQQVEVAAVPVQEQPAVVVASKVEEEADDADDDDKEDDKVANKAQKNSKAKKPAGKP